jgi:hypothetical protein
MEEILSSPTSWKAAEKMSEAGAHATAPAGSGTAVESSVPAGT